MSTATMFLTTVNLCTSSASKLARLKDLDACEFGMLGELSLARRDPVFTIQNMVDTGKIDGAINIRVEEPVRRTVEHLDESQSHSKTNNIDKKILKGDKDNPKKRRIREYSNALYYDLLVDKVNSVISFIKEVDIDEKVDNYINSIDCTDYYTYHGLYKYRIRVTDNTYPGINGNYMLYPNYYSFFEDHYGANRTLNRHGIFHDHESWISNKFTNNITNGPSTLELKNAHILSNLNYNNPDVPRQGFPAIYNEYVRGFVHEEFPEPAQLNIKEGVRGSRCLGWTINCKIGVNNSNNMIKTNLFELYKDSINNLEAKKQLHNSTYFPQSTFGGDDLLRKMAMAMEGNNSIMIGGSHNAFFFKWMLYQYIYSQNWIETISNYNTYTSDPLGLNAFDPDLRRELDQEAINDIHIAFITLGTFEKIIMKKYEPITVDQQNLTQSLIDTFYPVIVNSKILRDYNFILMIMAIAPFPLIKETLGGVISCDPSESLARDDMVVRAHYLSNITNRIYVRGYQNILFIIEDDMTVTHNLGQTIYHVGRNNVAVNALSVNHNDFIEEGEDINLYNINAFNDINAIATNEMTYEIFVSTVNTIINTEGYKAPYALFSIVSSLLSRLKMSYKNLNNNGPADDDVEGTCTPIPMNQLFVPAKEIQHSANTQSNYSNLNMFTLEYMNYNQQLMFKAKIITPENYENFVFVNDFVKYQSNLVYEQNKANYRLSLMLRNNMNMIGYFDIVESNFSDKNAKYFKLTKAFDEKLFKISNLFEINGIQRYILPVSYMSENAGFFTYYNPFLTPDANPNYRDWYYYYATINDIVYNQLSMQQKNDDIYRPHLTYLEFDKIKNQFGFDVNVINSGNQLTTVLITKMLTCNSDDNENLIKLIRFMTGDTINYENYHMRYEFKILSTGIQGGTDPSYILVPVYNYSLCNCIYNRVSCVSPFACGPWHNSNANIIVECFKVKLRDYIKRIRTIIIQAEAPFKNTRHLLVQEVSSSKELQVNEIVAKNDDEDVVIDFA
jgi:hypothetical protein